MPVHLRISKSIKRRPANYLSVMRLEDLLMELQPMPTRSPREKLELVLWTRKTFGAYKSKRGKQMTRPEIWWLLSGQSAKMLFMRPESEVTATQIRQGARLHRGAEAHNYNILVLASGTTISRQAREVRGRERLKSWKTNMGNLWKRREWWTCEKGSWL